VHTLAWHAWRPRQCASSTLHAEALALIIDPPDPSILTATLHLVPQAHKLRGPKGRLNTQLLLPNPAQSSGPGCMCNVHCCVAGLAKAGRFAGQQDQLEAGASNTSSKRSRVFTTVWHNSARCLSAHRCTVCSRVALDWPCGGVQATWCAATTHFFSHKRLPGPCGPQAGSNTRQQQQKLTLLAALTQ
jgi:hypothetical protein